MEITSKCQLSWDWKRGVPIPQKRQHLGPTNKIEKSSEKCVCIECLELSFLGKREEKFASLRRSDSYSLKRHNDRWHKEEKSCNCTIIPSTAPDVQKLWNKYDKSKAPMPKTTSLETSQFSKTIEETCKPIQLLFKNNLLLVA